jgi:hypothetical protein
MTTGVGLPCTHSGCSWYGFIASPRHRTRVRSHTCSARSSTDIEKNPVSSRLYDFLFWLDSESVAFSAWSSLPGRQPARSVARYPSEHGGCGRGDTCRLTAGLSRRGRTRCTCSAEGGCSCAISVVVGHGATGGEDLQRVGVSTRTSNVEHTAASRALAAQSTYLRDIDQYGAGSCVTNADGLTWYEVHPVEPVSW